MILIKSCPSSRDSFSFLKFWIFLLKQLNFFRFGGKSSESETTETEWNKPFWWSREEDWQGDRWQK